jgi:hypothetical protein
MDYIPGAVYRGVELQPVGKGHREFCVRDPDGGIFFINMEIRSFYSAKHLIYLYTSC